MPLTKEDWKDVFEHTRRRVRECGLGELDSRITSDFHPTEDAFADLSTYLTRVSAGLRERSRSGYARALEALREGLETESGKHIQGIEVRFEGPDATLYGMDVLDLESVADLEWVINELETIASRLSQDAVDD